MTNWRCIAGGRIQAHGNDSGKIACQIRRRRRIEARV